MRLLENFFWEQLTDYIHESDSYKDVNGRGLLERFLSVFGKELDLELVPKIEGLINQLDPQTATNEFLSEIAYQLGKPLDVLEDIQVYRTLLTQIISIYKVKGTSKSYQIFFGILGYSIIINEDYPLPNNYDTGQLYDTPNTFYDNDSCDVGCTTYSITYSNLPGKTGGVLTAAEEDKIRVAIALYLEPINAKLTTLTYAA